MYVIFLFDFLNILKYIKNVYYKIKGPKSQNVAPQYHLVQTTNQCHLEHLKPHPRNRIPGTVF
jgi:hypothetical protein